MTLELDPVSLAWLDALRSAHFPPERLVVGAHLTMFHALPGAKEAEIMAALAAASATSAPFPLGCAGLRFLGRGAAYDLSAPEAVRLRALLAERFAAWLTKQDRAAWSPHVTVQNKVAPAEARLTLSALAGELPPPITATGFGLWRYLGGPWEAMATLPFGLDPQRTGCKVA